MRLRITFAKTDAMRFTSHLDLHRAWERTFRRARLPLAYSQGFSPHPRLNLACALPLGFTSQAEILDVWLESDQSLSSVEDALQKALPPGIQMFTIQEVEPESAALQTELQACDYQVTLLEPYPDLESRCQTLLDATTLPRRRRQKDYDLRPLIHELRIMPQDEQGCQRVFVRLSARQGATGRPEEVLDAMGVAVEAVRVQRTKLIFQSPTG